MVEVCRWKLVYQSGFRLQQRSVTNLKLRVTLLTKVCDIINILYHISYDRYDIIILILFFI